MQYFHSLSKTGPCLLAAFALFAATSTWPALAAPTSSPVPSSASASPTQSATPPADPRDTNKDQKVIEAIEDQQPKLTEELSGFSDGVDLIEANRDKSDPSNIVKAASHSRGKLALYEFGKGYLRIFAEYVYLPSERGTTNSVNLSVTALNKTPLTFKSAIESQPEEVYSQRGQYFVTPFFALNTKTPLEIRLEQRQTRKAGTHAISFVQNLLTAAATVFTGGAASTISSLTNYARASSTVVGAYEANTTIADINRKVVFDDFREDRIALQTARIAFFTHGKEGFDVVDQAGNHFALKESMPIAFDPITLVGTNLTEADLKTIGSQKSAYQFHLVDADGKRQGPAYYPAGKQPFIILRFQVYNAYPNIAVNPDKVAGIHEHFRALDALYLDRMLNSSPAPQTTTTTSTTPSATGLRPLFDVEGKKLFTDLRTLTDAGDISLSDAASLMNEFAHRSDYLAGNTRSDFLHTLALSLYLDENIPNIVYPGPSAAIPAPPATTTTTTSH